MRTATRASVVDNLCLVSSRTAAYIASTSLLTLWQLTHCTGLPPSDPQLYCYCGVPAYMYRGLQVRLSTRQIGSSQVLN